MIQLGVMSTLTYSSVYMKRLLKASDSLTRFEGIHRVDGVRLTGLFCNADPDGRYYSALSVNPIPWFEIRAELPIAAESRISWNKSRYASLSHYILVAVT